MIMGFGIDREYILWECVLVAHFHICEVLRVRTGDVEAKINRIGDKLQPEFVVDLDKAKGVTAEEVLEVIQQINADCKAEYLDRISLGLLSREDCLERLHGKEAA